MFQILLLLFICVPVIEIALFMQIGGLVGFWPTISIVLVTAFCGATLVREQGIQTLMSVQNKMQSGQMPAQEIVEGVLLAVAGILLLTPGFLTDFLGFILLFKPSRVMVALKLMQHVKVQTVGGGFSAQTKEDSNTFEGEYEEKDEHEQLK